MVFARFLNAFLGSKLASFGTELLIAAVKVNISAKWYLRYGLRLSWPPHLCHLRLKYTSTTPLLRVHAVASMDSFSFMVLRRLWADQTPLMVVFVHKSCLFRFF